MARHNDLGKWGEQQAQDYLLERGFTIHRRDERVGHYEADIIAFKGGRIHFVEVKTRSSDCVDPIEAVTSAKQRRLGRFADSFIRSYNIPHIPQFDIITIVGDPNRGIDSLEYYPDAFFPPLKH